MDTEWSGRDRMANDVYVRVGATIRSRRGAAGMTQASLATEAGLARSSVTNIENGGQAILLHQLIDVAKALKMDPRDLLPGVDANESPAAAPLVSGRAAELLGRLDRPVTKVRRR